MTLCSAVVSRRQCTAPNTMNNTTSSPASQADELQDAVWHLAAEFNMTHLFARTDGYFAVLCNNADTPLTHHHPEVWDHALDLYHADGNREAIECLLAR